LSMMIQYVWLIPLFPLAGFLLNGIAGKSLSKKFTGLIACGAVFAAFILSVMIFMAVDTTGFTVQQVHLFDFFSVGRLRVPVDFQVDQLTVIFLLIITGVGLLIHIYSIAYMKADEGFARYFSYLNLFVFFMLLLVLGANYVILFIGWEGVGLCSYLLIGFWFDRDAYNQAAKKAFIMNRIGDLGFLIGLFLMFSRFRSFSFSAVFSQASTLGMNHGVIIAITLLLFIGATGKSAQIPLYTWLPDAMAGPTPVSALIHAATMVTAGIYMIARSNILYTLAPFSQHIVAVIGLATAVFAASIALKQYDIKKVLAYSTVSQLGYMFLGLGVGNYSGAVFHVMTHAFFKALLFLGAGVVIHAMGGEQDIRKMGGLRSKLPITYWTFLIACLAISGIPPLSGFFSKDEILGHAFSQNPLLYLIGLGGALLTAFYMFRLFFMTFHGSFRGTSEQAHHLHEGPPAMTVPLILLALLAIAGGWVGIPASLHGSNHLGAFLSPVFAASRSLAENPAASNTVQVMLMIIATVLTILIILWARNRYIRYKDTGEESRGLSGWFAHAGYVNECYDILVSRPLKAFSGFLDRIMESQVIDGLVNGVGKAVHWSSRQVRLLQSGQVGGYVFGMVAGAIILFVIGFFLIR